MIEVKASWTGGARRRCCARQRWGRCRVGRERQGGIRAAWLLAVSRIPGAGRNQRPQARAGSNSHRGVHGIRAHDGPSHATPYTETVLSNEQLADIHAFLQSDTEARGLQEHPAPQSVATVPTRVRLVFGMSRSRAGLERAPLYRCPGRDQARCPSTGSRASCGVDNSAETAVHCGAGAARSAGRASVRPHPGFVRGPAALPEIAGRARGNHVVQVVWPPRDRGMRWSKVRSSREPQYWHIEAVAEEDVETGKSRLRAGRTNVLSDTTLGSSSRCWDCAPRSRSGRRCSPARGKRP